MSECSFNHDLELCRQFFDGIALKGQTANEALFKILKLIASEFSAFGCIVWECIQTEESKDARETDRSYLKNETLYTLSSFFATEGEDSLYIHDLPVFDEQEGFSVSGKALCESRPCRVADVQAEGGPRKDLPFLRKHNIGPICSIPFRFHDELLGSDGRNHGTLDLHRTKNQPHFSDKEVQRLEIVVNLFPHLFRSIRTSQFLRLSDKVGEIIQNSLWSTQYSEDILFSILQKSCESIEKEFGCVDVSVVGNSKNTSSNEYNIITSTWKCEVANEHKKYKVLLSDTKESIVPTSRKTEWVLRSRKNLWIFDIANQNIEQLKRQYPGFIPDPNDTSINETKAAFSSKSPPPKPDKFPPISYIAVPLLDGQKVLGAIRCCGASQPPYYFTKRDVRLLELIAGRIAHLLGTSNYIRTQGRQLSAVEDLASGLSDVNHLLQRSASKTEVPGDEIRRDIIRAVIGRIPNTQVAMFWTYENGKKLLTCEEVSGSFFNAHQESVKEDFLRTTISVNQKQDSSGVPSPILSVVQNGKTLKNDNLHRAMLTNAEVTHCPCRFGLFVPVQAGGEIYGVLDLKTSADLGFSNLDRVLAELLGTQLGIYFSLIRMVDKIDTLRNEMVRSNEELTHQLIGPLAQARARADRILRKAPHNIHESFKPQVRAIECYAIRGLCRRALGVMNTLRHCVSAESGKEIVADPDWLKASPEQYIQGVLESAAFDSELQYHQSGVEFEIDRRSIQETFSRRSVWLDKELWEQVVYNSFDNAIKYSDEMSTVLVRAVRQQDGNCAIEISNRGIPLSKEEANNSTERGWRSPNAIKVTAQGAGLGNWLALRIMQELKGNFEILPTDDAGLVKVRLTLHTTRGNPSGFRY